MSAQSTRLATVGILVLVLGAGFLMGLAWERGLDAAPPDGEAVVEETTTEEPAEERRGLIVERVGLDADQQRQVDSIIDERRDLMRTLRAEYRTDHRALIEGTREALKTALTPEQTTQYDSLLAEFDRRRQEEEESESRDESQR